MRAARASAGRPAVSAKLARGVEDDRRQLGLIHLRERRSVGQHEQRLVERRGLNLLHLRNERFQNVDRRGTLARAAQRVGDESRDGDDVVGARRLRESAGRGLRHVERGVGGAAFEERLREGYQRTTLAIEVSERGEDLACTGQRDESPVVVSGRVGRKTHTKIAARTRRELPGAPCRERLRASRGAKRLRCAASPSRRALRRGGHPRGGRRRRRRGGDLPRPGRLRGLPEVPSFRGRLRRRRGARPTAARART
jgi:hypothetical protein